jgi:threonyl-tRNA synthetase
MVHRTIFGSMERFIGILIEHYAGAFPTWLAPVQARILPISDKFNDYGEEIKKKFEEKDIRVELDRRSEKVGYKIREAQMEKIPYMIIVGENEVENETMAVRDRAEGDLGEKDVDKFIEKIKEKIDSKVNDSPNV